MKRHSLLFRWARVCIGVMACHLLANDAWSVGQRQTLHDHVPAAAKQLAPIGRLDRSKRLKLAIGLPLRNQRDLARLLQELADPSHANYRKYLSPAQFTERFGPTESDYQAVVQFAKTHGLTVTATHPNRVILDVEATTADVEKAFHVTVRTYRHPSEKREFYAPDTEPSLDLQIPISNISGLDNYSLPHPRLGIKPAPAGPNATPDGGSARDGGYAAQDFRAAYVPGVALTGAGQNVALLEFDRAYPIDIADYKAQFGLPNVPVVVIPVDGGVKTPGDGNGEVSLDIEMALSMAPGLSHIYVYEAPEGAPWVDVLSSMANDNRAKQLSCSWGSSGNPNLAAEAIFQQMAAQGQSFFAASGDTDACSGAAPFPSDSPSITVVGATTLTTTKARGSYVSETVWNKGDGNGSSGGASTFYSMPIWQQGVDMTVNQGSTAMRNFPDVGFVGDNIYIRWANGEHGLAWGTSAALGRLCCIGE